MATWKKSLKAINQLSLRERRLLAITSVSVMLMLFLFVSWLPLLESWQKVRTASHVANGKIQAAKAEITRLEEQARTDVNAPYKAQLKKLRNEVADQENTINSLTSALITPKNMTQVFSGLLQENHLTIETVTNQQAQPVSINGSKEENHFLFKHGLSLEMKGQFLNTLKYIQALEKQEWQLYWDELVFTTLNYPHGTLDIKVHTLSTSEHVLGL